MLREVKSHKLSRADPCHFAEELNEEAEAALARQPFAIDAFFLRSLRTLTTSLMDNDVTYEDTCAIVDQIPERHAREVSGMRNGQVAGMRRAKELEPASSVRGISISQISEDEPAGHTTAALPSFSVK